MLVVVVLLSLAADAALVLVFATIVYSYFLAGFRSDGSGMAPAVRKSRRVVLLPFAVCVTGFMVAKLVVLSGSAGDIMPWRPSSAYQRLGKVNNSVLQIIALDDRNLRMLR